MHRERGEIGAGNLALLLLLGLLWGMPFALTKISLVTIPPITSVAMRVSFAAVALWIYALFAGCKMSPVRVYVPLLFVQGMLTCLIPHTLIALGQQSVDSALAAILNSTTPVYVCLLNFAVGRVERLTPSRWVGVVLGLFGVISSVGVGALGGLGKSTTGELAIIVATLSSAVAVIYGRRLNEIPAEIAAAGTLTSAALILIPLCFCVETPLQIAPSWPSMVAVLGNAIGTTALGFVIYFYLIRTIGSVSTSSVGYLKPMAGVLIGCMLMSETLTWTIVVGLVTTLVGVAAIVLSNADNDFLPRIFPLRKRKILTRTLGPRAARLSG
jgi:drug/metabolite transporter (DMT)-like permease